MKQNALSPLLFNAASQYIRKVQENQEGMELNGTHKLLVYVDDINTMDENMNTIKKNPEALIDANKGLV
jgi:hypothetical protein